MQVLAIRHDANVYGKGERDLYAGSTLFKKKYPASLLCIISMKVKKSESVSCSVKSMDWSLPGSSVHGILQARVLEWVAIPFSRGSSSHRHRTWVSPAVQADSLPSEPPGKPHYFHEDTVNMKELQRC